MICNTFAAPRECKTFADHFDFQFDGKFRQIDAKITQMQKNFCQFGFSYLVNSKAILLRDRQLGGIWFLLTLGSQFSSLGASPLGMKIDSRGLAKTIASRLAITQYYILMIFESYFTYVCKYRHHQSFEVKFCLRSTFFLDFEKLCIQKTCIAFPFFDNQGVCV